MKKVILSLLLALSSIVFASQNATQLPNSGTLSGLGLVNGVNAAIDTTRTMNSGSANPGAAGAYTFWMDTGANNWYQRNAANTAWVRIGPLLTELATTNASSLTTGTVQTARLPTGSTSVAGIVQLTNTIGASTTLAATPAAVQTAYDWANLAYTDATTALTRAPQAICSFNGATTGTHACTYSRGVTNVVRNGAGNYTINIASAMATATFPISVTNSLTSIFPTICNASPASSTTITVICTAVSNAAAADPTYISVVAFD